MRDSPTSPPAKGESPKRMVIREIAQSPTAASISREMSLSELTHAYHHLADQSEKDKTWAKAVEHAITDHAIWIDRSRDAFNGCQKQIEGVRAALGAQAAATPAPNTPLGTTTADDALRAHVHATDTAMQARLQQVETTLRKALDSLDTELRQHTQEAVQELAGRVHLLQTAQGLSPGAASPPASRSSTVL